MKRIRQPREPRIIGWRELIGLPELDLHQIRAKIDTGARTSALHAEEREWFERDGVKWVRFKVPEIKGASARLIEAPIAAEREIKNTSGVPELRSVIRTMFLLGHDRWPIDVSLADRGAMEFDLIVGRTALRGREILVDPTRSYLCAPPGAPSSDSGDLYTPGILPTFRRTQ